MAKDNQCVIEYGSNIKPEYYIKRAINLIKEDFLVISQSQSIRTDPIGITDQDDFLNGAILMRTELDFEACQVYLKKIEDRCNRVRTGNKYGPRTIDLDIIIWNGEIVNDDFYTRSFVRDTVREVYPEAEKL